MPSSYTPSLKLVLPVTGELANSWGNTVNTELTSLVDVAVAGYLSIAMTDADLTLTNGDGASANQARYMALNITGTLSAARNVICPTASKLYYIKNATTGGFAITLKTSGGSGVSIPNGSSMVLLCNGVNIVDAVTQFSSGSFTNLAYTGTLTGGTGIVNLGSGQFYKDASGNVGIGTASPGTKLDVFAASGAIETRTWASASASAAFSVRNLDRYWQMSVQAGGNFILYDSTAAATRLLVDSTGKLGIGGAPSYTVDAQNPTGAGIAARTTSSGNASLMAYTAAGGVAYLELTAAATGTTTIGAGTGGTWNLNFAVGGSERMRIDSAGKVGIGTSAPAQALDVVVPQSVGTAIRAYNSSSANGASAQIVAQSDTSTIRIASFSSLSPTVGSTSWLYTDTTTPIVFGIGGGEKMRLDTSGQLLIGTAVSSIYKLDVVQAAGDGAIAYRSSTRNITLGVNGGESTLGWGATTILSFFSGSERMRIDASGNVGIGTSATSLQKFRVATTAGLIGINVSGNTTANAISDILIDRSGTASTGIGTGAALQLRNTTSNAGYLLQAADSVFQIWNNPGNDVWAERLRIDASGNVGIGRAPTVKLDVNGGIAIGTITNVAVGTYTVLATDYTIRITATCTLTLPTPASFVGRCLRVFNAGGAFAITSASSNVVPQGGAATGTAILAATAGKWCDMQCDATNWFVTASN